jgi:hypothetical protein
VGEEVTERTKLGDVAELWLRELKASTKATRTKQTYQERWKRDLSKAVAALMVRELTVGVAERVLRPFGMRQGWVAPSTPRWC